MEDLTDPSSRNWQFQTVSQVRLGVIPPQAVPLQTLFSEQ